MPEVDSGLINGANLVGGLIQQGQQTQNYVSGLFDAAAKRRAGGLIAAGDNGGAAAVLGARGLLPETQVLADRQAASGVLGSVNAHDFTGARRQAAATGNSELYGTAATAEATDRAARIQFMTHAADALTQIPAPVDPVTGQENTATRHQVFQEQIAPVLRQMGLPDDQIAQIEGGHLTTASLQSFRTTLAGMQNLEIHTDANTGRLVGINPQTHEVVELTHSDPAPRVIGGVTYLPPTSGATGGAAPALSSAPSSGSAASSAPAATPPPWVSSAVAGLNPTPTELSYLATTSHVEGSGSQHPANNGSSTGAFQFHPATFYGVLPHGDIHNPADQARAALLLARQSETQLQSWGVANPTNGDLYFVHQQGEGGARALYTATPEVNAIAALTPVYTAATNPRTGRPNGPVLGAQLARQAIVGNGGTPDTTAGEMIQHWTSRFGGSGATTAASAPAQATPTAPATTDAGNGWRAVPTPLTPQQQHTQAVEDARLRIAQHAEDRQTAADAAQAGAPIDPRDTDFAAGAYLRTGVMPPLGMGAQAARMRQAIIHRAAEIERITGETGGDAAQRWVENRESVRALGRLQTRMTVVEQQADEAHNAAGLVLQALPNGGNGSLPIINQPMRQILAGLGNSGVTRFNTAVNTFGELYARVMTSNTGAAGSTEAASRRAHELLSPDHSPAQIRANMDQMESEMAGQRQAYASAMDAARARIRGGPAARRPATATPALSGGSLGAATNLSGNQNGPDPEAAPAGYRVISVR